MFVQNFEEASSRVFIDNVCEMDKNHGYKKLASFYFFDTCRNLCNQYCSNAPPPKPKMPSMICPKK